MSEHALRVLGIDPGSRKIGYGLVGKREEVVRIESGCFRPPGGSFSERLEGIHHWFLKLLVRLQPNVVVLETAFFGQFPSAALSLAQVRGVLIGGILGQGLDWVEYAPRLVKQLLTGYGSADKQQVAAMVAEWLGLKERLDTDEGDALALALAYLHFSTCALAAE